MQEYELETAERRVRDGERHVANQRDVVEHLREHGEATDLAESLLQNFEDLLDIHRQHLAEIISEQQ